jgi:mannose-6-phosphate isomerase
LRDAYDHVFVLLSLATVYQLSGEARVREELESLIAFFDAHLRSPQGRFIEGIPSTLPRR